MDVTTKDGWVDPEKWEPQQRVLVEMTVRELDALCGAKYASRDRGNAQHALRNLVDYSPRDAAALAELEKGRPDFQNDDFQTALGLILIEAKAYYTGPERAATRSHFGRSWLSDETTLRVTMLRDQPTIVFNLPDVYHGRSRVEAWTFSESDVAVLRSLVAEHLGPVVDEWNGKGLATGSFMVRLEKGPGA